MTQTTQKIVKLGSSIALAITVFGILLAAGGQLDFIGSSPKKTQNTEQNTAATPSTPVAPTDAQQTKYSFYDELKKRKNQLDAARTGNAPPPNPSNQPTTNTITPITPEDALTESYDYVIQVGGFSLKSDAQKVQRRAESLGYQVNIVQSPTGKFLIYVGPFKGKKRSVSVQERLKQQRFDTLLRRCKDDCTRAQ